MCAHCSLLNAHPSLVVQSCTSVNVIASLLIYRCNCRVEYKLAVLVLKSLWGQSWAAAGPNPAVHTWRTNAVHSSSLCVGAVIVLPTPTSAICTVPTPEDQYNWTGWQKFLCWCSGPATSLPCSNLRQPHIGLWIVQTTIKGVFVCLRLNCDMFLMRSTVISCMLLNAS